MLCGRGDMLYYPDDLPVPIRVQGSYISQEEIVALIEYVKDNFEADFDQSAHDYIFDKNG